MTRIDLITGFLGAGKTTFIKRYASYLMEKGEHIAILENDYGAVNVDLMLLQELMGDHCELEMVSGGCDPDCHRRRFKTKLIAMGMCGYDRVLVEPSGIYDVDEFFDALHEEPLDAWYEPGNVIAIVDARPEPELSETANRILASEAADAGLLVLSKSQESTAREIDDTIAHLNQAMAQIGCSRRFSRERDVLCTDWDQLTEADFDRLASCGAVMEGFRRESARQDSIFSSLSYLEPELTEEALCTAVTDIFADPACGLVLRIKGFLQKDDGSWLQLNATRRGITVSPIPEGQQILIVIGERLDRDRIQRYFKKEDSSL